MSNPTISIRLSDYHLARALRAVRTIEPEYKLISSSKLVKAIFNDFIAKSELTNNHSCEVNRDTLQEIIFSRSGLNKQLDAMPLLGKTEQL